MTLDDALSCGRIVKVAVKEGYSTFEEASSETDVRYGLKVRFKNLNGSVNSDVGILLENVKREQSWKLETTEKISGDVGLKLRWTGLNGANTVETQDVLEISTRESLTGFSAVFDRKARIERGRVLDYISQADKSDISQLTTEEANAITLYLAPKKFKDPKKPTEEVIGIFQDGVDPLISNELGDGISSNAVLAALVKSVQDMKVLISQLYAKRAFEYNYIHEDILVLILGIGLGSEISQATEETNYVITRNKIVTETTDATESTTDIETVGMAQVIVEDTDSIETITYGVQRTKSVTETTDATESTTDIETVGMVQVIVEDTDSIETIDYTVERINIINETTDATESVTDIETVGMVQVIVEDTNSIEEATYGVQRTKSVTETTDATESVTDIETVGMAQVIVEDTNNTEIVTYTLQ